MQDITLAHVRSFFSSFYREELNHHTLIRAGVLVPLFMQNGEMSVVFTQRTEEVEHHKGQVSFPGGTMDSIDATIIDFCTPSGFCITPVVGFLPIIPSFMLNKTEVSGIFNVPLSFFLDPRNERVEELNRSGKNKRDYFYSYGKYEIWGVTAEILQIFLHTLNTQINHKKTL